MRQIINSKDNNLLKTARMLHDKKGRLKHNCFLVEGLRLAEEAIKAKWPLKAAIFSDDFEQKERNASLIAALGAQNTPLYQVDAKLLSTISATEHSQGLILLAHIKNIEQPFNFKADFLMLADRLADPGNLGTIMRTALAAGCQGLILSPQTVDVLAPKTVRASMGAIFNLPIWQLKDDNDGLNYLQQNQISCLGAAAEGAKPYTDIDLSIAHAWLIGNEACGLSPFWQKACSQKVFLPMANQVESLNAAIAAAILLYATAAKRNFPTC